MGNRFETVKAVSEFTGTVRGYRGEQGEVWLFGPIEKLREIYWHLYHRFGGDADLELYERGPNPRLVFRK